MSSRRDVGHRARRSRLPIRCNAGPRHTGRPRSHRRLPWLFLCAAFVSLPACQDADWREYSNAGLEAYSRGDYAEAEQLLSAALEEAEKFGPADRRLARVLINLAGLYRTLGRYAEAEPVYERALAVTEQSFGPEHPTVAMVLENYALLLRLTGRTAGATEMEVRAKSIRVAS